MKARKESYDVIVCGGGMAGFCAAIAAARNGAKTCLVQDRPVLGGNSSSEVRVTVHGAACHHSHARETGIIGEALNAERRANHIVPIENGWANSVHDMALYDMAVRQSELTLHLNTRVRDVRLDDGVWGLVALGTWPVATDVNGYLHRPACHEGRRITAIRAEVANAETSLILEAGVFIDCTGDASPAHLAGCEWRMGSEAAEDTGELHAAAMASTDTMGNSIHIRCIDTGRPAPFRPPAWAVSYDDAAFFYERGRVPNEPEGGYWWIEIGVPWDTIHDNEKIRHELTRHALGVWDWMKNRDPNMMEKCRNYALEFIGQVPGKRESRRIMGLHFINETELQDRVRFPDECAYGGWFIDLHTPGGLLAESSESSSVHGYDSAVRDVAMKYIGPYGLPLSAMMSKDVPNLLMAGRNISTTHAALGTVRVMATCGLMGQAVGTLAAMAAVHGCSPRNIVDRDVSIVQQRLLRDGCFLPHGKNEDCLDLALKAAAGASSSHALAGMGAWERPEDGGLRSEAANQARGSEVSAARIPCQWLYLQGPDLDRIGIHFHHTGERDSVVQVRLRRVASLWAYKRDDGDECWSGACVVPAGSDDLQWLELDLHDIRPGCYRVEIEGVDAVRVRMSARHEYGLAAGHLIGSGRFHWNFMLGSLAMKVAPSQAIYGPEQAISGITRPREQSHLWLSNPAHSLPQYIELTWPEEVVFGTVELSFPTQLVLEVHGENPFYVAPHIARQYRLLIKEGGQWKTIHRERDNADRRRSHRLSQPVKTKHLRLLVEETHGARSAGLVEIRVYDE